MSRTIPILAKRKRNDDDDTNNCDTPTVVPDLQVSVSAETDVAAEIRQMKHQFDQYITDRLTSMDRNLWSSRASWLRPHQAVFVEFMSDFLTAQAIDLGGTLQPIQFVPDSLLYGDPTFTLTFAHVIQYLTDIRDKLNVAASCKALRQQTFTQVAWSHVKELYLGDAVWNGRRCANPGFEKFVKLGYKGNTLTVAMLFSKSRPPPDDYKEMFDRLLWPMIKKLIEENFAEKVEVVRCFEKLIEKQCCKVVFERCYGRDEELLNYLTSLLQRSPHLEIKDTAGSDMVKQLPKQVVQKII